MEGYVSFKDVEGLGAPPDEDEDDAMKERPGSARRWSLTRWLGLAPEGGESAPNVRRTSYPPYNASKPLPTI
jgi:hypothetical protein